MNTKKKLPIGVSEFATVITDNGYYVDKTMLIADWLSSGSEATLITRPSLFGKTLNMTMLRDFFDITKDSSTLFEGLAINDTPYITEMNRWPVIYLTFKDCIGTKLDNLICVYHVLLQAIQALPKDIILEDDDAIWLKQLITIMLEADTEKRFCLNRVLLFLCSLLYQHYGKRVIILIDNYDTPIISASEGGYYDEIRSFFVHLYGSALKDNPYLEKAMLTGMQRVLIDSSLNNLDICTIEMMDYQQYFGFTPEETEALLKHYDLVLDQSVKAMYDGYSFGGQKLYNPWSILNYADQRKLEPYWADAASHRMLFPLIASADKLTQYAFEDLFSTGYARVSADLQTSFFESNTSATLWGLLLNVGYLALSPSSNSSSIDEFLIDVRIPNQEIMTIFEDMVEHYGGFFPSSLSYLVIDLLAKDMAYLPLTFEHIIQNCTSFHNAPPENGHHMLYLGMCVYFSHTHTVTANLKHGQDKASISLQAKRADTPNFILELRYGEDCDKLSQEALAQIHDKQYYAGFQGETILLGIAHDLKHCKIEYETIFNNSKCQQ